MILSVQKPSSCIFPVRSNNSFNCFNVNGLTRFVIYRIFEVGFLAGLGGGFNLLAVSSTILIFRLNAIIFELSSLSWVTELTELCFSYDGLSELSDLYSTDTLRSNFFPDDSVTDLRRSFSLSTLRSGSSGKSIEGHTTWILSRSTLNNELIKFVLFSHLRLLFEGCIWPMLVWSWVSLESTLTYSLQRLSFLRGFRSVAAEIHNTEYKELYEKCIFPITYLILKIFVLWI